MHCLNFTQWRVSAIFVGWLKPAIIQHHYFARNPYCEKDETQANTRKMFIPLADALMLPLSLVNTRDFGDDMVCILVRRFNYLWAVSRFSGQLCNVGRTAAGESAAVVDAEDAVVVDGGVRSAAHATPRNTWCSVTCDGHGIATLLLTFATNSGTQKYMHSDWAIVYFCCFFVII